MRWSATVSTLVSAAAALVSPPAGSVSVGNDKGFASIQQAINTGATSVFVFPGTYDEHVYVPSSSGVLTIYGYSTNDTSYSANEVTISFGAAATQGRSADQSGTLRAHSTGFQLYNVNVVNTHGGGPKAVALSAFGDQQGYYGCQFRGHRATVVAGLNRQIFVNSYLEGATDVVLGRKAATWFERCDFGVLGASYGTLTANGRDSASNPSWFVLSNSRVSAAPIQRVAAGSYYLGRPWAQYARVTVQDSELSPVINAAGWHSWSTGDSRTAHVSFDEYGNSGPGSEGPRASFASNIDDPVTERAVLGDDVQFWVDTDYLSGGGPSTPGRRAKRSRAYRA